MRSINTVKKDDLSLHILPLRRLLQEKRAEVARETRERITQISIKNQLLIIRPLQ